MFHDPKALSALIGSRICHDLISPLGAISNGLELLDMSGQAASPEMQLISDSVLAANGRIRFFRVAYGDARRGASMAAGEITAILGGYFDSGRLSVDWHSAAEVARSDVRRVFLALQCLESALPYGGQISVRATSTGWKVVAEAEKLRLLTALWAALDGGCKAPADVSAAEVQFAILAADFAERSPRPRLEIGTHSIVMEF